MVAEPRRTDWWDATASDTPADALGLQGGVQGVGPTRAYSSPAALAKHANTWVGLARLIFAVAENDEENIRLIRSSSIDEDTMRQRRAVIWAAKLSTSAPLPEIARAMNRDHSAICRSLAEADDLYVRDPQFRALCKRIIATAKKGHGA